MRVLKNYFYSVGYQILNMILPLITGPYISRVLGPKGVGINTYTGAIVQYFVLIGGLGVVLYGNREMAYVKGNRRQMSITFWEIQILKSTTVFLAYIMFLVYLFFTNKYKSYLLIQSLYIIATGFDISWLYEGLENFKITFTRNTLVRLVSLILILLFVRSQNDVALYIIILSVSNLVGYMVMWCSLKKVIDLVNIRNLHPIRHLKGLLILFVPYLTLNIYPVINKTLLGYFSGIDSSGFYEKSDVIIRMVLTIVTSISLVLLPHTSKNFSDGKIREVKETLLNAFNIASLIALPITFGLAAIAIKFGAFFYGNEFKPVGMAMFIESLAIVFMGWSSIIGNQFLIPTNQNSAYNHSVIMGSVVNIVIDFPLIKLFGLYGAAIATVLSEAFIFSYQYLLIYRQVDFEKIYSDIFKYFISAIIMFPIVNFLSKILSMNILTLILQVCIGGVAYCCLILVLKPKLIKQIRRIACNYVKEMIS